MFGMGELLKVIVRRSVGLFHSEVDQDNALNTIDKWVATAVSKSGMRALATGDEHAPKEDVTLRTPPGGPVAPPAAPGLDYDKLAAAILRVQEQQGAVEGKVVER